MLHDFLSENGFVQNPTDHCVQSKQTQNERIILIIWVDDLIIAANDSPTLKRVKEMLGAKFKMKDHDKVEYFLGTDFTQREGETKMNQRRQITKILERFGVTHCKSRSTPSENKLKFDNEGEPADPKRYREVVGSLIYVMTRTKPDLSFIVTQLSQHLPNQKNNIGQQQNIC